MFRLVRYIGIVSCATAHGQDAAFICTQSSDLYRFDITSCQLELIGNMGMPLKDIALTPNGKLWGCQDGSIYNIDQQNATLTLIGTTPSIDSPALVALNNDTLLGVFQEQLWAILPSTGYAWPTAFIGFNGAGDLTWLNGRLYLTAVGGLLVSMQLESATLSVSDIVVIGTISGGDGQWFGANTILLGPCSSEATLMGFDGGSVYHVSPTDATSQAQCMTVVSSAIWGATSTWELPGHTSGSSSSTPNVFTPNGDGLNERFYPVGTEFRSNATVRVYNRWGNLVFHDSSPLRGWDGRDPNGGFCAEGVYYFISTSHGECGTLTSTSGYVTLLR